jgi:hypothetical protein
LCTLSAEVAHCNYSFASRRESQHPIDTLSQDGKYL